MNKEESGIATVRPLLLTVAEVAGLLSVSLPKAYELANQKNFPSLRVGRKILVSRAGLETWIDNQLGELQS
jgi:excisionase family DNA binding protein